MGQPYSTLTVKSWIMQHASPRSNALRVKSLCAWQHWDVSHSVDATVVQHLMSLVSWHRADALRFLGLLMGVAPRQVAGSFLLPALRHYGHLLAPSQRARSVRAGSLKALLQARPSSLLTASSLPPELHQDMGAGLAPLLTITHDRGCPACAGMQSGSKEVQTRCS